MPVTVAWDNEAQTIVRYICDAHWTWDEFFAAKQQANELMDTISHNIGVIVDAPPSPVLPANMLVQARRGMRTRHPNTKIVVLVITNSVLRTILKTMKGRAALAGSLLEISSSLDEARALVADRLERIAQRER